MNHKKPFAASEKANVLEELNDAIIEGTEKLSATIVKELAKKLKVPAVDIPLVEINSDDLRGVPEYEEFCAKEGVN